MVVGEESGDMVGCIISSEGFIGEACQPTGEYWYPQAGSHTGDCFMREAVFTRAHRRRGFHSPLRGQGVLKSFLVRSIFQANSVPASDDWSGSSGRPANGVSCWGWYYNNQFAIFSVVL